MNLLHTLFLTTYFFMTHVHEIYGYGGKNNFTIQPHFKIEQFAYLPTQSQPQSLQTKPIFQHESRQHQLNAGQQNQIDRVNNLCKTSQSSHQKKIGMVAAWLQARKIKKDQKKLAELLTKSKKAIAKTQQKSQPPAQQQKNSIASSPPQNITIKHQTTEFMQAHGINQQLFTQHLELPAQQQVTHELVAVLDQLATIISYRQEAIHHKNLINFCVNLSTLSQQANIAQNIPQAISGKNCCRGIMHYLNAMTGQISDRYQQLQKALQIFQPVLQEYSLLIAQHALQGAATTQGLELMITAGMLAAPTATVIATTCLIGATACIISPVCAQAAIDTLSCGASCIPEDWDKVAQDLDNFTTFLRSPETVARLAEFAGATAIPVPNLNNLVGQILSLRPVITQVQQSCGKTTQSIYLMTKNQIQHIWQQSVELLERPEFVDFNCAYKKIIGCNFFKLLPKSDPILIAAFDGLESNLITTGENQLITQLCNQSENSIATNVVKSEMIKFESKKIHINAMNQSLRKRIFSLIRRNIEIENLTEKDLEMIANVLKPGKIFKPKSYDLRNVNVQFSKNNSHIFADRVGHQIDSPEFKCKIIECIKNIENHLGSDLRDNQWFNEILPDGTQLWAQIRGDTIINCGINKLPKKYNCITGLSDLHKKQ